MSVPKVAVCHPYYRQWEGETAGCCELLMLRSAGHAHIAPLHCSGAYVEANRNAIVKLALQTGIDFDWLLWIDTDMIFPAETLIRLLAEEPLRRYRDMPDGWTGHKDIVGANYRVRTPPYGFAAHYYDGGDSHICEPGLWPMKHLPTGLLLTRFDIYRKMPYPWFPPGDEFHKRDDVAFCHQALELGYEIWCDHDLTFEVRHIAKQEIPWFTAEQEIRRKMTPVDGAQLRSKEMRDNQVALGMREAAE